MSIVQSRDVVILTYTNPDLLYLLDALLSKFSDPSELYPYTFF